MTLHRLARAVAWALPLALAVSGCSVAPGIDHSPPTLAELRRVTYRAGGDLATGAVPVDDFRVVGDLDGDDRDEAVVLLTRSPGGSGAWSYLAVDKRIGGRPFNIATAELGDRVQLRSARIENGRLLASGVRAGPGDAACCAGELVEWAWTLGDGRLEAVDTRATGRLSLDALGAGTWVLRAWDEREPAPALPSVTLSFAAGRFAGSAGCNRYTASASDGPTPGEVSVGPVVATRMACPDAQAAVEARFLQQLAAVRRYAFRAGRLQLTAAADDGSTKTMLFEAAAAPARR